MISLLLLLQLKHFVIDFPLQGPYQYKNKGTYGHLGGILHASLHGLGTLFVLLFFPTALIWCLTLALLDGIIHYHIDWAKMNLNNAYNLKPDNSEYFWWLLGLDQLLHQLTYIGIIYFA